ncbi:hypothetical protein [Lacticaseibacillus camelliae]|uniref:Lipoprotein n=1 Tax=Lacticaseibacillus camelliae DSM 22697 = JCM 13995 TaxID=1423730 RepID=A0A0R2F8B8_9LACO|nr:hypothetical protein [Lacticaseibacillus camelliae]KRN21594.1 hypothetical protein FC75_GL002164 [Lacticaseibacillus camelliae DSM 22697 = JCM 13995]
MKQSILIIPLALLVLGTAACGNSSSTNDSSSSKASSSKVVKKATKKHKSQKTAQSATTSKAAASSSSTSSSPATASSKPVDRLTQVKQAVQAKLPGAKFPSSYTAAAGKSLNVQAIGNSQNYGLYLSEGRALPFNDASLDGLIAPVAIKKTTYTTPAAAEAQINYRAVQAGLPTVSVGDHLTATEEGAAGSTYLTWAEGRWSLSLQSSTINGEKPLPLANQVTSLLSKEMLPVPAGHGAISLTTTTTNTRNNSVSWREGNALYTVSSTDPLKALQTAIDLK